MSGKKDSEQEQKAKLASEIIVTIYPEIRDQRPEKRTAQQIKNDKRLAGAVTPQTLTSPPDKLSEFDNYLTSIYTTDRVNFSKNLERLVINAKVRFGSIADIQPEVLRTSSFGGKADIQNDQNCPLLRSALCQ